MSECDLKSRVHPEHPMAYVCAVLSRMAGETFDNFEARGGDAHAAILLSTRSGLDDALPSSATLVKMVLTPDGLADVYSWKDAFPAKPGDVCVLAFVPAWNVGTDLFGYDASVMAEAPRDASPEEVARFVERYLPSGHADDQGPDDGAGAVRERG